MKVVDIVAPLYVICKKSALFEENTLISSKKKSLMYEIFEFIFLRWKKIQP